MKNTEFKNSGIKAATLVGLVENTAPFLFHENSFLAKDAPIAPEFRYVEIIRAAKEEGAAARIDTDLTAYYELCIAAHFATVGTFVPTDVDLAIRQKLWNQVHGPAAFEPLWNLVSEFGTWNEALVSQRAAYSPSGLKLSGHQGEWLSIAMGAYGCALKVAHDFVPEIRQAIEKLVNEQEKAITELFAAFEAEPSYATAHPLLDGIAALAHNLGDLDRQFDAWEIADTDALKRRVYRAGHEDALKQRPILQKAGVVYQKMLANENHRHFALREPKPLRRSERFLLNFGPFLDDWGTRIVKEGYDTGLLSEGDLREVVEALIDGWTRLNSRSIYFALGYGRALMGIANGLAPKAAGRAKLENLVPPVLKKALTEGGLRSVMSAPRSQFESQWTRRLQTLLAETNSVD